MIRASYINFEDVPAEYGIPAKQLRLLVARRRFSFFRPQRGTVLFERKVLEEWIKAGRVEPDATIARRYL